MSDAEQTERLAAAYRTLIRGSGFLAESLQARAIGGRSGRDALPDAGGARVVGNGLRELDRFLCLLLDQALHEVATAGFDHDAFARQTNAANKLRIFHAAIGTEAVSGDRLRAIGRVRACLHHCRGIVHNPLLYRDLEIAAAAACSDVLKVRRLEITFEQLACICQFYQDSAAVVMALCESKTRIP